MVQGWYYVESLTRQRHDRVQTESQELQQWTAVSTLGSPQHGVASNEVISWSTDHPLNADGDDHDLYGCALCTTCYVTI